MNKSTFVIFLVIILAIGGGAAWYLMDTRAASLERPEAVGTTTPMLDEGKAIYTNGPYGFTLFYPATADVSHGFTTSYHLADYWRANALPDATGVPIVEIVSYSTQSDHSYPRYFFAMVRVGASDDPKEIEQCLKPTPNQGETALPDVTINGTTFKAFSFQSAGMMQYVKGVSYRTLHEGKCIALEKIAVGSSYRDDPARPDDIADTELDAAYAGLDRVVESFSFAR